jgi:hypothetical protein
MLSRNLSGRADDAAVVRVVEYSRGTRSFAQVAAA